MRLKSFGKVNRRNGRVLEAERLLAGLAVEMEMPLCMVALALVVVAELVVQDAPPVFKRMHHILVGKERQHSEYARFVQIEHLPLHVS